MVRIANNDNLNKEEQMLALKVSQNTKATKKKIKKGSKQNPGRTTTKWTTYGQFHEGPEVNSSTSGELHKGPVPFNISSGERNKGPENTNSSSGELLQGQDISSKPLPDQLMREPRSILQQVQYAALPGPLAMTASLHNTAQQIQE